MDAPVARAMRRVFSFTFKFTFMSLRLRLGTLEALLESPNQSKTPADTKSHCDFSALQLTIIRSAGGRR
jgi:hypothetical protein